MVQYRKGVGVVRDATRHSSHSKEVHGEEGQINTNKEGSEVYFRKKRVIGDTDEFAESVVYASKDCENSTH